MHELAICESLLRQVLVATQVSVPTGSAAPRQIGRITLRIGPLAGVEPDLVRFAFPLLAVGTACEGAVIDVEPVPVQVRCHLCRETSGVKPNRLLCAACGAWRVTVLTGNEMLLASVELRAGPASHDGISPDV